ncbi:hypothetical protein [Microvirga sp. M2]|uniref:hypothetical protein n=1 Tax=Microvirga sp. M2 TaxID=3073270 RepID=UPI0039C40279
MSLDSIARSYHRSELIGGSKTHLEQVYAQAEAAKRQAFDLAKLKIPRFPPVRFQQPGDIDPIARTMSFVPACAAAGWDVIPKMAGLVKYR